MHVTRLQAENVKNLRTVDVEFDEDNAVTIKGPNGAGKSSILDAIWFALGGAKVHDDEVIRKGEEEAEAVVTINGYKVKRRWTENSTYLDVTDDEGREYKSPQSLLDDFAESFMFDPLEFLNLHPSDQKAKLLELTGHQQELEELESEYEETYSERREINRTVRDLESKTKDMDVDPSLADEEIPTTSELVEDLEDAKDAQDRKVDLKENAEANRSQAEELREKARKLDEQADEWEEEAEEIEVPDIDELQERVDEADEKRQEVERARELVEYTERLEEATEASEAKTERLEEIEEEKQDIIAGADLPEGLGFEDDKVTYEGVPLDQASMSEKLQVSMGIAMHLDPDLRIVQLRDASLLDENTRQEVIDMAEDMDFQVFLEMVSTEGDATIRIEDGRIVD